MNRACYFLIALSASACASATSKPVSEGTAAAPTISIVRRSSAFRDTGQVARGEGSIAVAVRAVDWPTDTLEAVVVELRSARDSVISRRPSHRSGIVVFDSVRVGTYAVNVSRIGLRTMRLPTIVVDAGCRAEVEVYLRIADISDGPPPSPQTPGRATITYCKTP